MPSGRPVLDRASWLSWLSRWDRPSRNAFAHSYLAVTQIVLHPRHGIPGLLMRTGATVAALPKTGFSATRENPEVVIFVGGDAGHPFSDRLVQGALAAQADFGCRVTIVRSGWNRLRMIEQLDEVLSRRPAAVCFPCHPGASVLAERVARAHAAGIVFTTFNVDLPEIRSDAEAAWEWNHCPKLRASISMSRWRQAWPKAM